MCGLLIQFLYFGMLRNRRMHYDKKSVYKYSRTYEHRQDHVKHSLQLLDIKQLPHLVVICCWRKSL